jgi:hypothetical protein
MYACRSMYQTERLSKTEERLELSVSEGITDMIHASRIVCKLYLNNMLFIDNTRETTGQYYSLRSCTQ